MLLLFAILTAWPARCEQTLDQVNPRTFNKFHKLDNDHYDDYDLGDRYEWTLYQHRYDQPDYGHRYEWTLSGLSAMSLCVEVDGETDGKRFRQLADDDHCPRYETEYRWDVPVEGQPSRCLKVDRDTGGVRFRRIVADAQCPKPATSYVWERGACNEVDGASLGGSYRRPAAGYLCGHKLDSVVAYGRPKPVAPVAVAPKRGGSRAPASVAVPIELDPEWREDPRELEDGVEHVHRTADKIHRR